MINETPPGFEKDKKNISIDFDGVIHDWSKGWHDGTCYGEPIKGALEAIKLLSKKYQIIVFTAKCRPDRPPVNGKTGKQLVIEWLEKHDLLDYISEVTHEKPRAMIYIDDKGYRFKSWYDTIRYLKGNL
jgi:FMN phosphatase YigB (HAD superfamily)